VDVDEAFDTHSMVWGREDMQMGDNHRTHICYLCVSVWMLPYTAIAIYRYPRACMREKVLCGVPHAARFRLGQEDAVASCMASRHGRENAMLIKLKCVRENICP
jgi:hypothetical protein